MTTPPTFRGLTTEGDRDAWAIFAPGREYRYMLGRSWDPLLRPFAGDETTRPLMVWVMLNPSSAGAYDERGMPANDPTVRKCIGFAKRHGCGGIVVVNLFAWIATDPRLLTAIENPVGPRNDEMIRHALATPGAIHVAGWGRFPTKLVRGRAAPSRTVARSGRNAQCFGTTQDGEPRHPLMLAYDTPLEDAP